MKTPPASIPDSKKAAGLQTRVRRSRTPTRWVPHPRPVRRNCQDQDARPDCGRSEAAVRTIAGSARAWVSPWRVCNGSNCPNVFRPCVPRLIPTRCWLQPTRRWPWSRNAPRPSSTNRSMCRSTLGVDARKSDQVVRGSVVLPAGTGKKCSCCRVCQGDKAEVGQGRRARTWSVSTISPSRSRVAPSTSTVHRHARRHARGRCAGPDPRSAWPDAEPQGRHR